MNLLAAKLYDPAVAVSKATSALLAMTAFDTTNLRLNVTVPAHGFVFFRMRCSLSGATTMPQVLLGVMNGATIVGRAVPQASLGGTALATTNVPLVAEFTVSGLTPGSTNFDAAYDVETLLAATNIHYGGPNDTTANNAWGGFLFEAWDPQPISTSAQLAVDSGGRVTANVTQVNGTAQTARDLGAQLDATVSSRATVALVWSEPLAGYTTAGTAGKTLSSAGASGDPWSTLLPGAYGAGTAGDIVGNNLNATITSRMATFTLPTNFSALAITAGGAVTAGTVSDKTGYSLSASQTFNMTGSITGNLSGSVGSVTAGVTVATNNDKTGYSLTQSFPVNFASLAITAGGAVTAGTISDKTGYSLTAAYDAAKTAGDATIANQVAIKAKTDNLAFTISGQVDSNIQYVNDVQVSGNGSSIPWGPV